MLKGLPLTGLIARLKRQLELLDSLTHHQQVVATVCDLRLHIEAITLELLARGADLSAQHYGECHRELRYSLHRRRLMVGF